jgi:hypothetical protein
LKLNSQIDALDAIKNVGEDPEVAEAGLVQLPKGDQP